MKKLHTRRLAKLLATAIVVALAPGWVPEASASECTYHETYGGLFCNTGLLIEVCPGFGQCFVSCGSGVVMMPCN